MDANRFARMLGSKEQTSHQRIASYVKAICDRYPGIGFAPREEWLVEQTLIGLQLFLRDVRCTDEERRAIEEFLDLATEGISGPP